MPSMSSRGTPERGWRWRSVAGVVVIVACVAVLYSILQTSASPTLKRVAYARERDPVTNWAPCNRNAGTKKPSTFQPESDALAASQVTPEPETRRYNDEPYTINGHPYPAVNYYVPTNAQLARFYAAKMNFGEPADQFNPYWRDVDGRDGMHDPTTDMLIQWAAHKWGIPEDWLRAEFTLESNWDQFMLGDLFKVRPSSYDKYPSQARIGGSRVYLSMGITEVQWRPSGFVGPGTEPLRWESTAFNLDFQAATLRYYYDDPLDKRTEWGDRSYRPCQAWPSLGGWYHPYPWGNAGQHAYIANVQQRLANRQWTAQEFLDWKPASFPPGVKFR